MIANKIVNKILGNKPKRDFRSKNKLSKDDEERKEQLERQQSNIINGMGDYDTEYDPATSRALYSIEQELEKLYNKKR
jgi:hypothetical protein